METKNFLNSETTVREAYEAPKCEIIEMQNEGDILVGSAEHEGIGDGCNVG